MFVGTSFFVKYRVIQISMLSYIVVSYFSFLMAVIYCLLDHFLAKRIAKDEGKLNQQKDTILAEIRDLKGEIAAEKIELELRQSLKKSKGSGSGKFDGNLSFKGTTSHLQHPVPQDQDQEDN